MLQEGRGSFIFAWREDFYGFILAVLLLLSTGNAVNKKSAMPCVKLDRIVRSCNIFLLSICALQPLEGKAGGLYR